uniref:ABC-type xenobiotic transporter n=1 Tax=Chenopodium quinoa TaxID=63459 RepID=A0A803M011_CHEQI
MRLNGTTKSMVANHLAETAAGVVTIRAFKEEDRFFAKNLELIDINASPFFHNFAAREWLIQRIETLSATVLATAALCMILLPRGTFSPGFIGMALSYGLTLNVGMVISNQCQCILANHIISVERLNQYMDIQSEAPEIIKDNRPPQNWPLVGKVEICNLQIRYRPDTPLVLQGISCTFEGGNKIGIVGRTGSGKTTLIGALFRLVEPVAGKIIVDGVDICSIGLHDLRSRFGIIPQDPTLFNGTIRFNLDPLSQHNDEEIWEVLGKCQLKQAVKEKNQGLDSLVIEDGSNWSMGQRQLFCLGRALLRKSKVLVLDEATACIDNATDMILQKTIRAEFSDSTVITVAHRIPTVMDCTKILAISDGKLVEYDEPMKLMKNDDSLFGQLVKEYWSHIHSADQEKGSRIRMENLWALFCGQSDCESSSLKTCSPQFGFLSKKLELNARGIRQFCVIQILSAVFNGCLGLVYIGFGLWILKQKLKSDDHSISPIHGWVIFLFHGVTWLLVGLITGLGEFFPRVQLRILSILAFLYAGIFCFLALFAASVNHAVAVKGVLDILSFLGGGLLLLSTYKEYTRAPMDGEEIGSCKSGLTAQVTPFSKAGLFSKTSFCWLNPLMKLGRKKPLNEDDLPKLRDMDMAGSCYLQFMDRMNKHKQAESLSNSSMFWIIVACYWKEILISGFFALLKILALSAGPLFLNSFIHVAEGKEAFRYEGYVLAISLFLSKILESLSQRQWYFRSKLIGLKVRSMLLAAIYRKQLRLSNGARRIHSGGNIMNYTSVDAYRIGEFPFWFHQIWTTSLQLCFALAILIHSVGLATIASLVVIVLTVICNTPLAKLQHKLQSKLIAAQDERLKAFSEALVNMKVLKMYAWETHFKNVVEELRKVEYKCLSAVLLQKTYNSLLFWTSPTLVSSATFGACYFLRIPLHASNIFTFIATLRLVQDPVTIIPHVISVVIHARLSFARIVKFLAAPELQIENVRKSNMTSSTNCAILMKSAKFSWEMNPSRSTLRNINLDIRPGEKVAICGEVGSGKSTLLAAILGEVPYIDGNVGVYGRIAYVSQTAWIQTGTIRENIIFGSALDDLRYQETLHKCSLVKDLEFLPHGDLTVIGERGINLSGGQKQRIQLARALYQDADIYLLDDPFRLFMEALSGKTVLLVTHQVDFLPAFHSCLDIILVFQLMSDGEVLHAGPYHELLASSQEFLDLVNAHKETAGTETLAEVSTSERHNCTAKEINKANVDEDQYQALIGDQLIKQEEREVGDTGFKSYMIYLNQNKGCLYFTIVALAHLAFVTGQILQNTWIASSVDNPHISKSKLIVVYVISGFSMTFFLLIRSLAVVKFGMESSKSLFSKLLNSLFRAPVSFYNSTPLGRILSRISSDLNIVDVDIPFSFLMGFGATTTAYATLGVMAIITWQALFVIVPVIYMTIRLQRYYLATAKELMRLHGTTKSTVANHLTESLAGAMTIRAFQEEDCFFAKNLNIIDTNASPFFHSFAANEWLIQRIEALTATVLAVAALCMVSLPPGTLSSGAFLQGNAKKTKNAGFIGMALSYGLTLNMSMVFLIEKQCILSNDIISVERLDQYMDIPSEAPEVIKDSRPPQNWPLVGKVEICNLQLRYRPDTPLVLKGISCTFEGGNKIGIVGRTGSGKTTLIGALFRLVEPSEGKIIVDGVDICSIGLHDLRSRFGIIPQNPTLFNGSVRFNLDPLSQHDDEVIWEVLGKCQLLEAVKEKNQGLDSLVMEDGSNWSMGQRQLFCLGRALLRKSRVFVLDEATASIDNATDMILQKTIRAEFSDSTVITVAHRIPTMMDCTKVLAISDGNLVEYDEPMKLMKNESSLFGQLVKEYWSHIHSADQSY